MSRFALSATPYHSRGRRLIAACLGCAQAMAPDWPVLILWPLLKLSLASSIKHLSGGKPGRLRDQECGPASNDPANFWFPQGQGLIRRK